jgi:hypothetical protein
MESGWRSRNPTGEASGGVRDCGGAEPESAKVNGNEPAAAGDSPFPSLMTDAQVEDAAATRRHEPHDPYRRKDKPDPWPIIERGFPRIAEKIRALWGKRALDDYFGKLVVDDRGNRQGFPLEVLSAILEVARLHASQHRFDRPMCPWEADVSQTKWWSKR